jgi:transposase
MQISTIGIDLSKNVFQVHGVDAAGGVDHQKTAAVGGAGLFCGSYHHACMGMEACAISHHWARELKALGHEVRLMPPSLAM